MPLLSSYTRHDEYASDIDEETFLAAFTGADPDPEQRAAESRRQYAERLSADYRELAALADTPRKQAVLNAAFSAYRTGYRNRYRAWLISRARWAAIVRTGRKDFPSATLAKRTDAMSRKAGDLAAYRATSTHAMRAHLSPERTEGK